MIGIRVNKTLLVSATKSSFLGSIICIESIIEREETFEYSCVEVNNMFICEKYTMKSTQPSEENSAVVVSVDE